MKKIFFLVICISTFVFGLLYSEEVSLIFFTPVAKNFPPDVYNYLQQEVIANLQDLSDFSGKNFVESKVIEQWANFNINEINATNTNIQIVKGKKVLPKKIPPVSINGITPAILKNLSIVNVTSGLNVSFLIMRQKQAGSDTVNVAFSWYTTNLTKPVSTVLTFPLQDIYDKENFNRRVKETLVELFGLKDRYYYIPQKTGSVGFSVVPKNASIDLPLLNKKLVNGVNSGLPVGRYIAIIRAEGYSTIITNIEIAEKPINYKINLSKLSTKVEEGIPSLGSLYVDSDFPGAKFLIVEDGISGETPILLKDLKTGEKTILFDESVNYKLKTVKVNLVQNDMVYAFVSLERKGNKIVINSTNEGATVVVDRQIAGKILNGKFEYQGNVGLHSLTLLKDRYTPFRTNFTLEMGKVKEINLNLSPKSIIGFFVTPQAKNIPVFVNNNKLGVTPLSCYLDKNELLTVEFRATNEGYNILLTNLSWMWGKLNNVVTYLTPLFGDLKIFTDPADANLFIEGSYRGKIIETGLNIYQLQAKRLKVRIEKDGYKTINTNIYIAPNVENQFKFILKEAPVKIFITTLPEKGFDVYVNNEWSGISGETIIPFELGKNTIKINKRGFKTIITNVELKEKTSLVYTFQVEQGVSEDEFIENISNNFSIMEDTWKNKQYEKAIEICTTNINEIKNSMYNYLSVSQEIKKNFESRIGWLVKVTNMIDLINKGVELENLQDYKNAREAYEEAFDILSKFESGLASYFEETKLDLANKIENVKKIMSEKEEKTEIKNFVTELNSLVLAGDKLVNNGDYDGALAKYQVALKKIESSGFSDNPRVIELKERINKRIKNTQKLQKEKSAWWPNIQKSWSGFNVHFGAATLSLGEPSFESEKMNIMGYGVIGLNFIPFFGLRIGGTYNFVDVKDYNYVPYGVMAGAMIGIPVISQFSLFVEYFLLMSDFVKLDILNNSVANFGFDIKFGWFGLRLYYELGFKENFQKIYHGIGGGITFWITEE